MSEKLYKSSDVIDILLGELSHMDYFKVIQRLALVPSAIVRCKDCEHWLGIEEESPACAPCDAYDDDTPLTKMIMTPRYGFCYKGEPKDGAN